MKRVQRTVKAFNCLGRVKESEVFFVAQGSALESLEHQAQRGQPKVELFLKIVWSEDGVGGIGGKCIVGEMRQTY